MTGLCFASQGNLNSLIPSPVTLIPPSYNLVFSSVLGAPSTNSAASTRVPHVVVI